MSELTPELRAQRARIAAHTKWANTDPVEGTKAARAAFLSKFEQQADPDGVLDPVELARRVKHLKKAHFARLAYLSAQARRGRSS